MSHSIRLALDAPPPSPPTELPVFLSGPVSLLRDGPKVWFRFKVINHLPWVRARREREEQQARDLALARTSNYIRGHLERRILDKKRQLRGLPIDQTGCTIVADVVRGFLEPGFNVRVESGDIVVTGKLRRPEDWNP